MAKRTSQFSQSVGAPTSEGMLRGLKSHDQAAYGVLYERYKSLFVGIANRAGLHSADSKVLTQEIICAVYKGMETFERKRVGSFRKWLTEVGRRIAYRLKTGDQRQVPIGTLSEIAASDEERPDLLVADAEHKALVAWLYKSACEIVRRVHPLDWEAFQLVTIEGNSLKEASEKLEISLDALKKRVSRVKLQYLKTAICELINVRPDQLKDL